MEKVKKVVLVVFILLIIEIIGELIGLWHIEFSVMLGSGVVITSVEELVALIFERFLEFVVITVFMMLFSVLLE